MKKCLHPSAAPVYVLQSRPLHASHFCASLCDLAGDTQASPEGAAALSSLSPPAQGTALRLGLQEVSAYRALTLSTPIPYFLLGHFIISESKLMHHGRSLVREGSKKIPGYCDIKL